MMSQKIVKTPVSLINSLLFLCLLVLAQNGHTQAGNPAGKVVFAMGTPQAVDTTGTARNLARGEDVFAGDRLVTGRGRLQVSMVDGAFISIQPNSEYAIDNYNYSGQPDGTEQAVYRLAKGGVRAVTGLIGRTNTEAYKVNTAVATIGIRGTGHNTRICAGDCAGGVRDGLYHNTWEGITYVVNDVDSEDVPAGQGVYVEDIDTPIVPLDQPSVVTAAVTRTESGRTQERDDRERQDQSTLIATGEQRTREGDQTVVVGDGILRPTTSVAITGLGLVGVAPDLDEPDDVDVFTMTNASVFKDSNGKVIGIIGLVDEDFGQDQRGFGTINLNAVLGADNPTLVAEIRSLLGFVNETTLRFFSERPAQAVETTFINHLGYGRWADGRLLTIDEDGEVNIFEFNNFQSLHFIFGPDAGPRATSGSATYNFIGGTRSTSVSGATIGNGVTSGNILVNFGLSSANINMTVDHINIYSISGPLNLDITGNGIFDSGSVIATGGSGVCLTGCNVFIDGGFAGPGSGGMPTHIGIEYDIQETDVITGVAGFAR